MMRRADVVLGIAALSIAVAAGAGCSNDGRELRPPSPGQTTTSPTTSSTVSLGAPLTFMSPGFAAGGAIPAKYTCDGDGISPPLEWNNLPKNAVEVGIVVTDPDSNPPGFVHWVVAGLPAANTGVGEDSLPEGAVVGRNDSGGTGWTPPCPPSGEHNYVFTIYALGDAVDLSGDLQPLDAAANIQEAAIATASFTATYTKS
jgi:Raf kinase inhibitor-like YbhB/YbcL family protein